MEDYTQNGEFSVTENVDNLTSEINVVNNLSSNLESPENIVSEVNSNDSMDSMLSDAEQINSELDLPTSEKYVGGDTDSISVIVDNSNNKITATIKQIKFKTAFDFPPAGSSKLLYVAEDEKAIYYWDSELAIYVKASGGASEDSGYDDTEIRSKIKNLEDNKAEKTDLDNYYTKSQTYTKQEVDIAISNVEVDLSGYYTKTETDNVATQTLNSAKGYTDTKVAELIDSAPETLDTFKEIADAFAEDQEVLDTLNSAIGLKADKAELSSYATKTELNTGLDEKVDKVTGKGLSTNDYTTDEKNKLASLKNYDDTSVKADITALQQNKADKTELSNYVTNTALESKGYLTEIPSEYVTEAELETKNYATKTELSNGLNNKVDKVEGKGLSTNDLTDDLLGKINNNTVIEITESSVHIKDLGSGIYKLPMGCTFSFYATNKFTAPSESYLFVTETNEGRREFYILCSDYYAQTGIGNKYLISGYAYIPSAVGYSYKFVINKDYVDTSTDQSEIYGIKTFKKPVKMTEELSQNVIDDNLALEWRPSRFL